MPRIRKQTSNRQTTRDRAKIHKKSVDNKRKTKKAAKKDQTWKSKKKQDPGIPNSFPFKDQILAELAEERRKAEEEKVARREAAKAAKSAPPQEEEEGDTPGIISLGGSVLSRTAPLSGIAEPSTSAAAVAADVPDLIDTALATLQDVIDRADVICEVVDGRDILGGRSGHVEGLIKEAEGRVVLLVNKIDLVPREALESWISQIDIPTFLFKSSLPSQPAASSSKTPATASPSNLKEVWGKDELYSAIQKWSAEKQAKSQAISKNSKAKAKATEESSEPLALAFMGLPSVGKTSILNSLLPPTRPKHAVAPYIPTATAAKIPEPKTKAPVEVEIEVGGEKVRIIDTPGWEYAEDDDEEDEDEEDDDEEISAEKWDALESRLAGDLLRRNLGRVDKVKDALPLVNYIIKRSNHQDLMLAYNVPYFEAGDLDAFLTALARAQGRIKKHGTPDLEAAARVLLRDWAYNTFPYYTPAPKSASIDVESSEKFDLSSVLEKCKAKKDLKRENGKGLIRFKGCQEVDKRDIILDDDYTAMAGPSDDEDDEEEDDEEEDELDDDDEDEEEDDDEDDEGLLIGSDEGEELELEDGPEPSSGSDVEEDGETSEEVEEIEEPEPVKKRKRASLPAPSKKAKRVSFAKDEKPLKGILKRKRN
ncbi:uncharacterized protein I303_101295 [Kwoniella dejecticola CBS 10117]|uniref:Nuclear GTP-binding protein n=1 Tax=Kwoniella dejecticola CBS 10117 TaxID=1296121 RepID=A0A1A6AHD9_9TREE|nr:nuclear GTP-binding protein [Kwoniella dejecticola CBS 10117]OBR89476.1 nuclear GTP-binding protein [Kwoniella dejecticola CBS 10117]